MRKELNITQPGHEELREAPELVTDLAIAIYQHFYGDLDDGFDTDDVFDTDYQYEQPADELPPLPRYSEERLAGMDEEGLLALVTGDDDRLPREVVDACASRADAMVPLLHPRPHPR